MTEQRVVTERELDAFRAEQLSPDAVLRAVEENVVVLHRLPVGVGKSHAADRLLSSMATYCRFDLVIYAAPTWAILDERIEHLERGAPVPRWVALHPRPVKRCGGLNPQWRDYEARSCGTLAKRVLCTNCPHFDSCSWPERLASLEGTSLVLLAEEQLRVNRNLVPMLRRLTKAGRVLVVLDEARLLDARFELFVDHMELRRFAESLAYARTKKITWPAIRDAWINEIDGLLSCSSTETLQRSRWQFSNALHEHAYFVQKAGWQRFENEYRYAGYDLSQLARSRPDEMWIEGDMIRFIARPYLGVHQLILSAHLTADYAGHRLGTGSIASPFERTRFRHSETLAFNLRNRTGIDRYFDGNKRQVLDTFAALIVRNIGQKRTTLLVAKKKRKAECAQYLRQRLAGWGLDVRFVLDGSDELPVPADPRVIPIIHYGVMGVNDYSEYEAAYCLTGYYTREDVLNNALQEFEPRETRARVEIRSGPDRCRRVCIAGGALRHLGDTYLRKLEVDPVIQAVGRVRFVTRPREVVFFQMADLEPDVPGVRTVKTLQDLRERLGIPRPRLVDEAIQARRARELMAEGLTAKQAAAEIGISRKTLFRRLKAKRKSVKNPQESSFIRGFDTLRAADGGAR